MGEKLKYEITFRYKITKLPFQYSKALNTLSITILPIVLFVKT